MGIWFEIGTLALLALIFRQLQLNGAATNAVWSKVATLEELQRDTVDTQRACLVELEFLRRHGEPAPDPYDLD